MIDFIGDIHGYADKLEELLIKLGYYKNKGVYSHPTRRVLFVGDYIDRGPQIRETLKIVKAMVDVGNAIALLGNHEYNALCFHLKDKNGKNLRKHSEKNINQHLQTLKQFQNRQQEWNDYMEWFKTLPLFYETETFRAIHACWNNEQIEVLRKKLVNDCLTDELIEQSVKSGTTFNDAIDVTLKGKEIALPNGVFFKDKDGAKRTDLRIKWWENPTGNTYKSISVEAMYDLPETPIDIPKLNAPDYYNETDKPVFFGHYWLQGNPSLYRNNICCLDYSVANKGKLVAYRFDGELQLSEEKLVYV